MPNPSPSTVKAAMLCAEEAGSYARQAMKLRPGESVGISIQKLSAIIEEHAVTPWREALDAADICLRRCFDPLEDNENNPAMQRIGKAIDNAQTLLTETEVKGG